MRQTGLQYQMRMALLAKKLAGAALEYSGANGDVARAPRELREKEQIRDAVILKLKELEAVMMRLLQTANGVYPWGLPRTITREEWEQITGEKLEGGN